MSFTIVFIPGYQSYVPSTKSTFLQTWCDEHSYRFITFNHDFSSPNSFVGTWFNHLLSILYDKIDKNDNLILIGASLGAWLAILILLRKEVNSSLSSRIRGILTLGMSINGTEIWLNEIEPIEYRSDRTYIYRRPSSYSSTGYYDIPVSMLLDSKEYLLPMMDSIQLNSDNCILSFMHGMLDIDVPYQRMIDFVNRLKIDKKGAIEIRLIHDGDHRLSRDEDLNKIKSALNDLIDMSKKE